MTFTFQAEKRPFPRWWGPFSPARGTRSGFRFCRRQLGTYVSDARGNHFWPVVHSQGVQSLADLVLDIWGGGRVLLLSNGLVIKPLQESDEVGVRRLIGRFRGPVILQSPLTGLFDLSDPGCIRPGELWRGPTTTGLECVMRRDGSLRCNWYHPSEFGRDEVDTQIAGPNSKLAEGFCRARPGQDAGRVRITANGHIITNRKICRDWRTMYVGYIPPDSLPFNRDWIQAYKPEEDDDESDGPYQPQSRKLSWCKSSDAINEKVYEHVLEKIRGAYSPNIDRPPDLSNQQDKNNISLKLYPGVWPTYVRDLAKYVVYCEDGKWKIGVLCAIGDKTRYLAVEGSREEIDTLINAAKSVLGEQSRGAFYINEYRHIIMPGSRESSSVIPYYFIGKLESDLFIEFEGRYHANRPVGNDGKSLSLGEAWLGPHPGIPYSLTEDTKDIYYECCDLSSGRPQQILPARKRYLSRALGNEIVAMQVASSLANYCSRKGRFYVNEHGTLFTPKGYGDGNGYDYVYCGQIDPFAWFPEPHVEDTDEV